MTFYSFQENEDDDIVKIPETLVNSIVDAVFGVKDRFNSSLNEDGAGSESSLDTEEQDTDEAIISLRSTTSSTTTASPNVTPTKLTTVLRSNFQPTRRTVISPPVVVPQNIPVVSQSSSSSSSNSGGGSVVNTIANPFALGIIDTVNTGLIVTGLVALPFLIPAAFGKRKRRSLNFLEEDEVQRKVPFFLNQKYKKNS